MISTNHDILLLAIEAYSRWNARTKDLAQKVLWYRRGFWLEGDDDDVMCRTVQECSARLCDSKQTHVITTVANRQLSSGRFTAVLLLSSDRRSKLYKLYNFITVASITCWWIKVAQTDGWLLEEVSLQLAAAEAGRAWDGREELGCVRVWRDPPSANDLCIERTWPLTSHDAGRHRRGARGKTARYINQREQPNPRQTSASLSRPIRCSAVVWNCRPQKA